MSDENEVKKTRKRRRSSSGDTNSSGEVSIEKDRKKYLNVFLSHDELASFCLRSVLSSYQFSILWSVMSDLQWKWTGGTYRSPDGQEFSTSKDLCEQLDFFAIPSISFRDILSAEAKSKEIGQHIMMMKEKNKTLLQRQMKLRNDILEALLKKQKFQSGNYKLIGKKLTVDSKEENSTSSETKKSLLDNVKSFISSDEWEGGSEGRSDIPDEKLISATSIEPGAEQYLERKRVTRSKSEKKVNRGEPKILSQPILIQSSKKLVWKKPKQCVNEVKKILSIEDKRCSPIYETIEREMRSKFQDWKFQLSTNHSILLFGFGSKERLLNDFSDQELKDDGQVLTLNGYDLEISIEKILDVIIKCFVDKKHQSKFEGKNFTTNFKSSTTSNRHIGVYNNNDDITSLTPEIIQKSIAISRHLAESQQCPIYLVIHNIDGLKLQNSLAQKSLAALVVNSFLDDGSRVIRLIASVDHVNSAALLWDTETNAKFSWIWKLTNTHRPYYNEIEYGAIDCTRKLKQTQKISLDIIARADAVLKSLAPRHTEILQTLAKMQLEEETSGVDFVSFTKWKKRCPFTNEKDLRSMMRELTDHRILVTKVDEETGKDMVMIPANQDKLKEIIAMKKKA